jgi:uncharacterized protein
VLETVSSQPVYLALVLATAFGASIIGGISGFGAGLIVTPILLPLVGAKGIVPVVAVTMLIGNLGRILANRHDINPKLLVRLLIFIVPGVASGAYVYSILPNRILAIIIGSALIASVMIRRALEARQIIPSARHTAPVAFFAGFFAGNAPGGGVIVVSLLLSLGLHGTALIGTDAVIGAAISLTNTTAFGSLGLMSMDLLLLGLAIGSAMLPGAFIARALVLKLHARVHVRIVEAYVLLGGLTFFWYAYRG